MADYQITDTKTPIIIVVGPASSGKSMIMVRIGKYLHKQGYKIEPDYAYLNTPKYVQDCADFMNCLNSNIAMPGTVTDLLIQIKDPNGNKVAQYLEAPGEGYFDPNNPGAQPPQYLQYICGGDVLNKKIFIYLLDFDSSVEIHKSFRSDSEMRGKYEKRLIDVFMRLARPMDKTILLYNKLDKTDYGTILKITNKSAAEKEARENYARVFSSLKKKILGGFITYDDFKFMVFSTGSYSDAVDDAGNPIQQYNNSDDIYPKSLWKEIIRKI